MASYRPYPPQSTFRPPQPGHNPSLQPPQTLPRPPQSQYPPNWGTSGYGNQYPSSAPPPPHHQLPPPPLPPQQPSQQYPYPPPPPPPESSYPQQPPPPPPSMNLQQQSQSGSLYYPASQYSQYNRQPLQPQQSSLPPPPPPLTSPSSAAIPPPPPSSPPPASSSAAPPLPPHSARAKESGADRGRHERDRRLPKEGNHHTASKHHHKPPPSSLPAKKANGAKVETEEERRLRKKKEMEKLKHDERHRRHLKESQKAVLLKTQMLSSGSKDHGGSSGSRMGERRTPAPLLAAERIENRLKKPTTFLCRMKFRNELPDPTAQPKLMTIKRDKDRFTRYAITSLEKMHKPKLYVEPDLGIPLDLLDLSVYMPPKEKLPLDPEDEELLRDEEPATPLRKDGVRRKERPSDQGLSWLVKTQYISPLSNDAARRSLTEKQAKELRETREGLHPLESLNSRERHIKEILASFEACKSRPVHATNKSLRPVEVLPLLPYSDHDEDEFVTVNFDGEPTMDSEMFSRVDKSVRDAHEAKAVMKSFVTSSDTGKPEKFLGYMVPRRDELSKNIFEDEDVSYTWVREYNWEVKGEGLNDPSTYLVTFDDDAARYIPLPTKLSLRKRRAREGRPNDDVELFVPPAKVLVRRADEAAVFEQNDAVADSYMREGTSGSRRGAEDDMEVEDGYEEGLDPEDGDMGQSSGGEDDMY